MTDELTRLQSQLAEAQKALTEARARPVGPDRCPFTGRAFWGNIEHEDLGLIATYGGPYDTYTIPQREDDDPDYYRYRFDQDEGGWVDGAESIGKALVDDQLYTCEDDPAELQSQLAAVTKERDALREGVEKMANDAVSLRAFQKMAEDEESPRLDPAFYAGKAQAYSVAAELLESILTPELRRLLAETGE